MWSKKLIPFTSIQFLLSANSLQCYLKTLDMFSKRNSSRSKAFYRVSIGDSGEEKLPYSIQAKTSSRITLSVDSHSLWSPERERRSGETGRYWDKGEVEIKKKGGKIGEMGRYWKRQSKRDKDRNNVFPAGIGWTSSYFLTAHAGVLLCLDLLLFDFIWLHNFQIWV